ncbi:MAG: efflux RND transporter periplasmic adaptor subunit [Phycisphaeraceae bacterium]|nr:efflux RND transporter periplasmic adaptor subunit [Phycisphaeraceae bacterium]
MRRLIIILIVLAVLIGVGAVFAAPTFRNMRAEEPTAVRTDSSRLGTLTETISAPGTVEPVTKVDISAEVSARIVEIRRREGERVEKGEVVIRLDDRDLRAALQAAEARRDGERYRLEAERARIVGARQNLLNAKQTQHRQEQLYATGDVSRQALDDAMLRVSELEAQVQAAESTINQLEKGLATAEAQIEQAREAVRRTTIISNIDGVVTLLNAEVGELVVVGTMNNPGTRIMTIADLSQMRLLSRVSESDIARIARDQDAEIFINAYKDRVFKGRVSEVPLQRQTERDNSGFFPVKVALELNGEVIFSGLGGNVDIVVGTHEGVIVPSQAVVERRPSELPAELRSSDLIDRSGRRTTPIVFKLVDGRAVAAAVRVGPSNLTETLIVAGLEPGEQIITGPFRTLEKLKAGDLVKPDENAGLGEFRGAPAPTGRGGPPGAGGGGGRRGGGGGGGMSVRF